MQKNTTKEKSKSLDTKKFYFSRDDLDNFKTKDSIADYITGIIHQDKLFYIQVAIFPRLGIPQETQFRPVDNEGKPALETGKEWVAFEIPANTKKIKVADGKEEQAPTPKTS